VTLDTLPPTTAGLDRALTLLQEATGCPDSVAERLLGEWERLNVAYTDNMEGEILQEKSESYGQGDSDFFRNFEPLPVRVADEVYQAALL